MDPASNKVVIKFSQKLPLIYFVLQLFLGSTGFLLKATKQFVRFSFRIGKVIICQISIFLFELTFYLVPFSFKLIFVHSVCFKLIVFFFRSIKVHSILTHI